MRFHQAITFLPSEDVVPLVLATEELGYDGIYVSDHLLNPKDLTSRYTYSTAPDGSPGWSKDTPWPDPMCLISGLATITHRLTFTTGVYVAPVRDLVTVARTVGTTAVLSGGRVRLGVGVGWCKEEFDLTGQDFSTRGRRLDEMIAALRQLWKGGWVEYHGRYYDVPACQMNPAPPEPIPILGGGHSEVALRRSSELCDGWIAAGAYNEEEAWQHLGELDAALRRAGRHDEPYTKYLSLAVMPDVDLYRRFEDAGVTDMVCAPWMFVPPDPASSAEERQAAQRAACEQFAEEIVAKFQ